MENNKILLKDILKFDQLREMYPNRTIKLRYNENWTFEDKKIDFKELYREDKKGDFFRRNLLTMGGETHRRIRDNEITFQFIEIAPYKWLLVGVHKIISEGFVEVAEAEDLEEYNQYLGRVVVEKPNLGRTFYTNNPQIVDKVEVIEIMKKHYLETEEEFNGYENVCKTYKELKQIIDMENWKTALSNVYGVYAITDRKIGKLYIGSAYGENGIYGRWKTYLKEGFDKNELQNGDVNYPNKQLKELVKTEGLKYIQENFQYSILEIFPKNESIREKVLQRESYWKDVFRSREYGYNDN